MKVTVLSLHKHNIIGGCSTGRMVDWQVKQAILVICMQDVLCTGTATYNIVVHSYVIRKKSVKRTKNQNAHFAQQK